MKSSKFFKFFNSFFICLLGISAFSCTILYATHLKKESVAKNDSIQIRSEYFLSISTNISPTQEVIFSNLIKDYSDDFTVSSINDLSLTYVNDSIYDGEALVSVKPNSNIYNSGVCTVKWNLTSLINLASVNGATFAINPVYSKSGEVYSIGDLSNQQIRDLIYSQTYSHALNFNQINLQIDTATQSVTMTPKDNSTVYQQNSAAVANMNVTSVASLSYTYPTLTQSRLSTGNPVFTYRGKTVTATYTISEGGNVAPLEFNTSTGVLTLTANKQFNGGIYNITGSFTDTNGDGQTYTASFAVCVQQNNYVIVPADNVMTLGTGIIFQGGHTQVYQCGKMVTVLLSLKRSDVSIMFSNKLIFTFKTAYAPRNLWWGFSVCSESGSVGSAYVAGSGAYATISPENVTYCDGSFTYSIA